MKRMLLRIFQRILNLDRRRIARNLPWSVWMLSDIYKEFRKKHARLPRSRFFANEIDRWCKWSWEGIRAFFGVRWERIFIIIEGHTRWIPVTFMQSVRSFGMASRRRKRVETVRVWKTNLRRFERWLCDLSGRLLRVVEYKTTAW